MTGINCFNIALTSASLALVIINVFLLRKRRALHARHVEVMRLLLQEKAKVVSHIPHAACAALSCNGEARSLLVIPDSTDELPLCMDHMSFAVIILGRFGVRSVLCKDISGAVSTRHDLGGCDCHYCCDDTDDTFDTMNCQHDFESSAAHGSRCRKCGLAF